MRLGVALAMLVVAGCASEPDRCDDCIGYLALTWRFVAADGTEQPCPTGFDSVAAELTPRSGSPIVFTFPCAPLAANTTYVDGGGYDVVVRVTNAAHAVFAASSPTRVEIPILGGRAQLAVDFTVP